MQAKVLFQELFDAAIENDQIIRGRQNEVVLVNEISIEQKLDIFYKQAPEKKDKTFSTPFSREIKDAIARLEPKHLLNKKSSIVQTDHYHIDVAQMPGTTNMFKLEIQGRGKDTIDNQTVAQVIYDPLMLVNDLEIIGSKIILLLTKAANFANKSEAGRYYCREYDVRQANQFEILHRGSLLQAQETSLDYMFDYNELALKNLLELRLESATEDGKTSRNIKVLEAKIVDIHHNVISAQAKIIAISDIIISTYSADKSIKYILIPILIPKNALVYHWVGVAVIKTENEVILTYLDSENQGLSVTFHNALNIKLQESLSSINVVLKQQELEAQRYNNCGPELIENFIYCLTGNRATQEAAVYLHSILYENLLLDPEVSGLQITENNKIIQVLSNQIIPMYRMITNQGDAYSVEAKNLFKDVDSKYLCKLAYSQFLIKEIDVVPVLSIVNPNILMIKNTEAVSTDTFVQSSIKFIEEVIGYQQIKQFQLSKLFEFSVNNFFGIDLNWQYKQVIYAQDIKQFLKILYNNDIDKSIDILRDNSDFRKSVLLKLHPDKGGNTEDFVFVKELQEKLNKNLDIKEIVDEKLQYIQPIIHKASLGFKALDIVTDTIRLFNDPNFATTKKIAFDFSYLYGMYSGLNGFSFALSGVDSLYQCYQGEYEQALKQVATTAGYMALPTVLAFTGIPYLGLVYGTTITGFTGYHAVNNAYSLYLEYNTVEWQLKSAVAYKNLYEALSNSPLQYTYDFSSNAKWYEIQANSIKLEMEKAQIKQYLEVKGEFGEKLYEHIYVPMLEEKYELLEAKHISLTIGDQHYEHCISIVYEDNDGHYNCYNMEQEILDHVILGENGVVHNIEKL